MATFALLCLIAVLFGPIHAGNFVGKVTVKFNVFTVIEGDSFEMTCTARHEDERPDLRWYFIDPLSLTFQDKNLTSFRGRGSGLTVTDKYTVSRARLAQSGDYYCIARVRDNNNIEERKTSAGVPIQVIEEENRPRVIIKRSTVKGKTVLLCQVYPQGNGYLTWRRDGNRVKYDNKKRVSELELPLTSGGEYQCHGNVTLGGYRYFTSTAYASGATGLTYTTTQTTFLSFILFWFVAFLNL